MDGVRTPSLKSVNVKLNENARFYIVIDDGIPLIIMIRRHHC
jgi:hypothetical protein